MIGSLFKSHKQLTLEFSNHLYTHILPKVLADKSSDRMYKFGIFLIDDMIEYLGFELLADKWPHFCEALIKFSTH